MQPRTSEGLIPRGKYERRHQCKRPIGRVHRKGFFQRNVHDLSRGSESKGELIPLSLSKTRNPGASEIVENATQTLAQGGANPTKPLSLRKGGKHPRHFGGFGRCLNPGQAEEARGGGSQSDRHTPCLGGGGPQENRLSGGSSPGLERPRHAQRPGLRQSRGKRGFFRPCPSLHGGEENTATTEKNLNGQKGAPRGEGWFPPNSLKPRGGSKKILLTQGTLGGRSGGELLRTSLGDFGGGRGEKFNSPSILGGEKRATHEGDFPDRQ